MTQAVLRVVGKEDSDKKRALEAALSQIDRAFGKGSVMRLGQREKAVDADAVDYAHEEPRDQQPLQRDGQRGRDEEVVPTLGERNGRGHDSQEE